MELLISFIIKEFILMKRYIVNSLSGAVTLYIIFFIIFQGYSEAAGGILVGDTIEALIIGYIIWILAISSFQDITFTIQDEKKEGTIVQLFMAKYSLIRIFLTKAFSQFILNLCLIIFMLIAMMLTTNHYLQFPIVEVMGILFIINLNFWGIGFFFGGLTLIYKKMESALQIMQFAFMALVVIPIEKGITKYLPSAWGIEILKRLVNNPQINYEYTLTDITLLIVPSIIYFSIGLVVFYFLKEKAIRKGIVEQY